MNAIFNRDRITESRLSHEIVLLDGSCFTIDNTLYDNSGLVKARKEAIVVFPGFAEQDRVARETLAFLASMGIPAVSAVVHVDQIPRSLLQTQESSIQAVAEVATQSPYSIGHHIADKNESDKVKAIGNSSGSGTLLMSLELPDTPFGDIAPMQPVGLSRTKDTLAPSTTRLIGQFIHNAFLVSPPWRKGLTIAGQDVASEVTKQRHTIIDQFALANSLDTRPQTIEHAKDHLVAVICGGEDRLFRVDAMVQQCENYGIPYSYTQFQKDEYNIPREFASSFETGLHFIELRNARHENLAYPKGQKMVRFAAQMLGLL